MEPSKITKGLLDAILKRGEALKEERISICKSCPLYCNTPLGEWCTPFIYVNDEGETSSEYKEGYINGCGCYLNGKTRGIDNECPLKKC